MYTRRNSIESSGQHWLVLLAALLTTWMAWGPLGIEVQTVGAASALGLLLLNAVAVTLLATYAVRKGQSLERHHGLGVGDDVRQPGPGGRCSSP